ncbi:lipoprotein [Sedimenticola thiotaurini]|uniref:Lipoprotein n=1 Tax=Sedimenticola thiotaurini TaxID=1543721 RepID=A0A0F7K328_9GAMM|nr:lipoprotein [Sedimenticola thiotaurini]
MQRLTTGLLLGLILAGCSSSGDWRSASRESANLAPDPETTQEAVLQVYGADAWGWRGWFAIHTWVAAKRTGEPAYKVYDVIGWRARRGEPVMQITRDVPDRYWFGEKPEIIKEYRGEGVDQLIDAVEQAAREYPWKNQYTVFPGPNSNTFTAWIAKRVPELELTTALPISAIGKSYVD